MACLVAGMAAGADSIDDMDLLRHGAMPELFGGVRAPSTLGSFLRSFTWGNVRQLEKAGRELLAELACRAPLLPGADQLAFVDFDSMQRRVYGHKKQGAAFGHTKISGQDGAGPRAERAGRHDLHAAGRAGDRRHPAARRQREHRPRRRRHSPPRRSAPRGPPGAPARSWPGRTRGCTARRSPAPAAAAGAYFSVTARMDPAVKARDRLDTSGRRLDADPVPAGDLG